MHFLEEEPAPELVAEAVRSLAARSLITTTRARIEVQVRGDLGIALAFQHRARTVLDARVTGTEPDRPWRFVLMPQPEGVTLEVLIDALGIHFYSLRTTPGSAWSGCGSGSPPASARPRDADADEVLAVEPADRAHQREPLGGRRHARNARRRTGPGRGPVPRFHARPRRAVATRGAGTRWRRVADLRHAPRRFHPLDPSDAAEADVAHAGVDHLRAPGGRPVAQAVAVGAEERPALDHLARDAELRLRRVVALLDCRRAGCGHAARLVGVPGWPRVPVGRPLPDVAGHVVEAEAVGREGADRRRRRRSPSSGPPGEVAVPVVRQPLPGRARARRPRCRSRRPARRARRAPTRPRSAAPCRPRSRTPRRPRRRRARPGGPRGPRCDAAGPVRVPPPRARRPRPPLAHVPQVDRAAGRREHERARDEVLGRRAREVGRVERPLGDRDVAGRLDERGELRVRDLVPVDPEPVHADAVRGRLLRVVLVRAHRELAARRSGSCRRRSRLSDRS